MFQFLETTSKPWKFNKSSLLDVTKGPASSLVQYVNALDPTHDLFLTLFQLFQQQQQQQQTPKTKRFH